ncbi:Outer membrane protein [Candidatus Methylobacter favarea]|uniref:Outer membrane protein n=1 Tax=Candidatus Methylobacter favarea TaxID=2707345 RepID=A0A8S0W9B7_9GAMM|nr:TolC family outer membrane protein [Candidatus Methylobacter favarea]CAA9889844.1 Outer membrane protein [Candidatus Methylobacter favarea]
MTRNSVVKKLAGFVVLILTGISYAEAQNLLETYELALQNDPVLKQAQANQSAIGETKDQSIARFLPNISATGASSRVVQTNSKKFGLVANVFPSRQEYWNNTISVNLTQPVFHWDYWVQLSQSDNQTAQAEAAYQAELQNLMVKTTQAYFNVLSAQDNLEFTVAEKQAISRQLEQAKQRFEVGVIAITDVNEAQAGFDQALANEIEAANNLDNQKEALREIIGENDALLSVLGRDLPLSRPDPDDIKVWSNAAEATNFSIISAFNQAEVSRKSIALQRSGHLPRLDLVASYGQTDNTSIFGLRGDAKSVGVQFNMPLFEGGAVNSRTRQASYEYEAAKEKLNETKRSVKRQVKDAYRGVVSTISRVEALSAAVTSAESALEATEAGFEVGTRTMVDVLNEQRNLFRAKRDFSRTRYDYLINSIKLKQASSNLTLDDLEQINRLLTVKQEQ